MEHFAENVKRAAFAAAYLEGRSLEDVRKAVHVAQKKLAKSAGVNDWLHEIRLALRDVKPGSGVHRGLSVFPGGNS